MSSRCGCSPTCTTSRSTATTSARRSTRTPTASGTCRSRTHRVAANPAPERSTSTGYLNQLAGHGYRGYVGLEYKSTRAGHLRLVAPRTARVARRPLRHTTTLTESRRLVSTIAFIGLGIMGSPMAVHLAKAGHQVVGYNRSPERTAALVEAGGTAADSIAKAVAGADVVAVMVPDSPDVQAVLAGEDGVFEQRPGRRADHRLLQHPARRHHRTRRAGRRARIPADRRTRYPVARPVRSTPRCRSWSAAPRKTSSRPSRSSTSSGRRWSTWARAAPGRRSRQRTS